MNFRRTIERGIGDDRCYTLGENVVARGCKHAFGMMQCGFFHARRGGVNPPN
jgi:hypothetical protein